MGEQQKPEPSLGAALLQAETSNQSAYEEYRMKLELALTRAERFERTTYHVCWVSLTLACVLTFVGGTQVAGSFDPSQDNATPLSIGLGIVYVLANITWPLALASYYSRFRPKIRTMKHELLASQLDQLQQEVEKLRGSRGE